MLFHPEYIKHKSTPKFAVHALRKDLKSPFTKATWNLTKKAVFDFEAGIYCIELEKFDLKNFFESCFFVYNQNGVFTLLAYDEHWKNADNDFSFTKQEMAAISKEMADKYFRGKKEEVAYVTETSLCMANMVISVQGFRRFSEVLVSEIDRYLYEINGRFKF